MILEPFKGGGRGGSRRKNKDAQASRSNPYIASIFIFFIVLYSLTFLFSFLRK
jgi:hypothetical protein